MSFVMHTSCIRCPDQSDLTLTPGHRGRYGALTSHQAPRWTLYKFISVFSGQRGGRRDHLRWQDTCDEECMLYIGPSATPHGRYTRHHALHVHPVCTYIFPRVQHRVYIIMLPSAFREHILLYIWFYMRYCTV